MFQLTFLGTSSGIPTIDRNVSGLAIECINPDLSHHQQISKKNRPWILIDCGEGTQHQLLYTKLSTHRLQAICITHVHGDHCYGLAGLLASMSMSGRKDPLKLIAPRAIEQLLQTFITTTHMRLTYHLEFIAIEDCIEQNRSVELVFAPSHNLTIDAVELSHRVPSYGFVLSRSIHRLTLDKEKLIEEGIPASEIWGQLQQGHDTYNDDGRLLRYQDYVYDNSKQVTIVVGGDNDDPQLLAGAVEGATLLVHEATYTQEISDKIKSRDNDYDPQHSTVKQVAEFAKACNIPNLILTHISARYQKFSDPTAKTANVGHLEAESEQNYHGQCWIAQDFDQFLVDTDNCVTKL